MTERHYPQVIESDAFAVNHEGEGVTAEQAYRVYVMTGMRSMRRTADLLGLPHGTVLSWSQRYQWTQRVRDQDLEVLEGAAEGVVMAVIGQIFKTVETMAEIRDDKQQPGMARVEAGKSLLREYQNIMTSFGGQLMSERAQLEAQADDELEELVQTPEGVQVLLERQRQRTGRA